MVASSGYGAEGASGRYGIGLFVDYLVPASAFNTWHKPAPEFGANLSYALGSAKGMALEFEYHYARFKHGRIEKKSFIWGVDKKAYQSPSAQNRMTVNSGLINTLIYFGPKRSGSSGKASPYLAIGTGFYNYVNRTENLIYPGQKKEPLDTRQVLEPAEDNSTAFGVSLGFGVEMMMGPKAALDLRGRYHTVFGHLNPMEAWGVKETFPIQIGDVRVAMRFYL
jgi:opacity protein-like surface antigen